MSNGYPKREISWFWIIMAFIFVWPVGIFLMFMKIFSKSGGAISPARGRRPGPQGHVYRPPDSQQAHPGREGWDWRQQAQNAEARPVQQQQAAPPPPPRPQRPPRSYQPEAARPQAPSYNYSYSYGAGPGNASAASQRKTARLERKISAHNGKGLFIGGWITAGVGAFSAAITFIAMMANWEGLFESAAVSTIVAFSVCVPGAVMAVVGNRKRERAMRCQTFYAMARGRKSIEIQDMAAAVPCSFNQACRDLRWMIHEGFFPGAYIDASKGVLVYGGTEPEPKKPEPKKPETPPAQPGVFPEVARIRQLNDEIADAFVSERMDRLEALTHKIFAYIEANPGKEERIRQFRQHYLPKTIKILESYARFERQGVAGANILAAMKDVEEIMDTLVNGFEKQLDMLFVDEALDVTTDINVLENMMGLQGLSSDDPFKLEFMGGGH